MYPRAEAVAELATRRPFVVELETDPAATWFAGVNLPEQFTPENKAAAVQVQIDYLEEVLRVLDAGESVLGKLAFTVGAVRIGGVAVAIVHALVCGDSNGLFGYLGDDAEIDRGGYETDSYWKMLYIGGLRLAPAKGSADRVIAAAVELLWELPDGGGAPGDLHLGMTQN